MMEAAVGPEDRSPGDPILWLPQVSPQHTRARGTGRPTWDCRALTCSQSWGRWPVWLQEWWLVWPPQAQNDPGVWKSLEEVPSCPPQTSAEPCLETVAGYLGLSGIGSLTPKSMTCTHFHGATRPARNPSGGASDPAGAAPGRKHKHLPTSGPWYLLFPLAKAPSPRPHRTG